MDFLNTVETSIHAPQGHGKFQFDLPSSADSQQNFDWLSKFVAATKIWQIGHIHIHENFIVPKSREFVEYHILLTIDDLVFNWTFCGANVSKFSMVYEGFCTVSPLEYVGILQRRDMSVVTSHIIGNSTVCSSDREDLKRKHQSSTILALSEGSIYKYIPQCTELLAIGLMACYHFGLKLFTRTNADL